jgi:hypothetical protein
MRRYKATKGPTEQIGNGNGHGTGLSSWIVGARAGPTGRFGASNDLVAPTHRGRPGSRGSRRLSENRSAAEARSGPLRRVEAPVHDTRYADRRVLPPRPCIADDRRAISLDITRPVAFSGHTLAWSGGAIPVVIRSSTALERAKNSAPQWHFGRSSYLRWYPHSSKYQ